MYEIFKKINKVYILLTKYLFLERSIQKELVIDFIKILQVKIPSNLDLIRIGSKHDGGYLVPNILEKIEFCFSAGVGKNIDFEKDLLKYNIKSFGCDLSVDNPPEELRGYNFLKKNINSINDKNNITFEKWVNDQNISNDNLIGQIDIEGAEYNLILNTPDEILKNLES